MKSINASHGQESGILAKLKAVNEGLNQAFPAIGLSSSIATLFPVEYKGLESINPQGSTETKGKQ